MYGTKSKLTDLQLCEKHHLAVIGIVAALIELQQAGIDIDRCQPCSTSLMVSN